MEEKEKNRKKKEDDVLDKIWLTGDWTHRK